VSCRDWRDATISDRYGDGAMSNEAIARTVIHFGTGQRCLLRMPGRTWCNRVPHRGKESPGPLSHVSCKKCKEEYILTKGVVK